MPRNIITGVYTLPAGNPVVTGNVISSTWANTTLTDIATALTNSIANNGTTTVLADLPLNTHKLTGVGDPTNAQDAATKNYVDTNAFTVSPGAAGNLLTSDGTNWGSVVPTFLNKVNPTITGGVLTFPDATTQSTAGLPKISPTITSGGLTFPDATTQSTAGVAPTKVIGISQTWQNVTGSRAGSTNYTNSTGKPIQVNVTSQCGVNSLLVLIVDGINVAQTGWGSFASGIVTGTVSGIVPNGSVYSVSNTGTTVIYWAELR